MIPDPIIEEVRSARQKIFEACNEDLDALLDRFQEHERLDQERVVANTSTPVKQVAEDRKKLQQKIDEDGEAPKGQEPWGD